MDGIFDNSSSDEESQAVLNNYYAKQAETVSRLNIERAGELKAQVFNYSSFYKLISYIIRLSKSTVNSAGLKFQPI